MSIAGGSDVLGIAIVTVASITVFAAAWFSWKVTRQLWLPLATLVAAFGPYLAIFGVVGAFQITLSDGPEAGRDLTLWRWLSTAVRFLVLGLLAYSVYRVVRWLEAKPQRRT